MSFKEFKPYPKYKESGIKWLGEVPEHWEVKRLKHIADVRLSNVDKHTVEGQKIVRLCNYLDVYNNTHITSKIDFMSATASDEQIERLSLQKDDVIITKDSEDPSDIGIPALVEEDIFGLVCGYHLAILRPIASNGEYLRYLLQSTFVRSAFEIEATGMTRYALGKYSIENLTFALPHQSEQHSIALFLDHETSRIDTLISEKERLISLLQEYRQALISHAVTKGLDPNVKMKDSKVEWLREVPEHWEINKISTISKKITNGYVGPTREIFVDYGVPYLQSLHIKNNRIIFEDHYYVSSEWSLNHEKSILEVGDVLIVQTGDIGRVAAVTSEFSGSNCHALIIVSPIKQIVSGDWISIVLNSSFGFHSLSSIQTGALHPHLNCGNVKDLYIPIPCMEEQKSILSFLRSGTSKIDSLIQEAERAIELLKEYRQTLISAAVTGKIDIRG